jgi:hypothetical protein
MIDEDAHTEVTEEAAKRFLEKASKGWCWWLGGLVVIRVLTKRSGMPITNAEILRCGKCLKDELALDKVRSCSITV